MCYEYDTCDVYHETFPKARKRHHCAACSDTIEPGELYCRGTGVFDGSGFTIKVCRRCQWDTQRIGKIEMSRGCSAMESTPIPEDLSEALSCEGLERTPKDEIPEDFDGKICLLR